MPIQFFIILFGLKTFDERLDWYLKYKVKTFVTSTFFYTFLHPKHT